MYLIYSSTSVNRIQGTVAYTRPFFLLASYSSEVCLLDPNPTRRLIYQIKALLSVFPAHIRPSTKLTVNVLENQLSAEAFRALAHLTPKQSLFTQLSYDSETHGARRRSNLDPRTPPEVSIERSCSPLTPYLLGVRGG